MHMTSFFIFTHLFFDGIVSQNMPDVGGSNHMSAYTHPSICLRMRKRVFSQCSINENRGSPQESHKLTYTNSPLCPGPE